MDEPTEDGRLGRAGCKMGPAGRGDLPAGVMGLRPANENMISDDAGERTEYRIYVLYLYVRIYPSRIRAARDLAGSFGSGPKRWTRGALPLQRSNRRSVQLWIEV